MLEQSAEASEMLEKRLRQKSVQLESAVARTSNTKLQLRDNADLVKNEIRACFGQQLATLRSREQQLLANLDTVVTVKDEILTQQQDQLHQALGACLQGLECLTKARQDGKRRNSIGSLEAVEQNLAQILNRLSGVELNTRETPHVTFEVDQMHIRRTIQTFGRITTTSARSVKSCESLPADLEEYEDDQNQLSHKPFQLQTNLLMAALSPRAQIPKDGSSHLLKEALTGGSTNSMNSWGEQRRNEKDQVSQWLRHMKTQVETEPTVFDDFGLVRRRKSSEVSCQSSFETVSQSLFSGYFQQVIDSPMSDWVMKPNVDIASNNLEKMEITEDIDMDGDMLVSNSYALPANRQQQCESELTKGFEQVFTEVKESDPSIWLLMQHPISSTFQTPLIPMPDHGIQVQINDAQSSNVQEDESDLLKFFWLLRPAANEQQQQQSTVDVESYETVLDWQTILQKVHGTEDEQQWLMQYQNENHSPTIYIS